MPITIKSLGAAQEVTGSCHLLTIESQKFLFDCGMHQGGDAVKRLKKERFAFNPKKITAVILSHAHLDHSGLLPLLVRKGFRGPIYCTAATRNMLAIMLEDSANIYFRDLERGNRRLQRSGRKVQPREYEMEDVLAALGQCQPVDYHHDIELSSNVTLRFFDAGHILGSAIVQLTLSGNGIKKTLIFSGDLGSDSGALISQPEVPPQADVVLMESTYGNRDHRPFSETLVEFEELLATAKKDRGVILMPAFAIGRTQELLYHLGCFYHQGKLDGWKVFLDSPMAIEVTQVYDQWFEMLTESGKKSLQKYGANTLKDFLPSLSLTRTVEESSRLNRLESGAIIIAGSGMCNGGRIKHHLKQRLWKDSTHIVFSGFQAAGTLGRQLVEKAHYVRIFSERYVVNAQIHTLGGFSAHAGRTQLINWAMSIEGNPSFRLVHGEQQALLALAQALRDNGRTVSIAEQGEEVEL